MTISDQPASVGAWATSRRGNYANSGVHKIANSKQLCKILMILYKLIRRTPSPTFSCQVQDRLGRSGFLLTNISQYVLYEMDSTLKDALKPSMQVGKYCKITVQRSAGFHYLIFLAISSYGEHWRNW